MHQLKMGHYLSNSNDLTEVIIYLLGCGYKYNEVTPYLIVYAGHDDGQVFYEPQGHDHHVDGDEDVVSIRTHPSDNNKKYHKG